MRNPVARLKAILGEVLLNGRLALQEAREGSRRLDTLDQGLAAMAADLRRLTAAVESRAFKPIATPFGFPDPGAADPLASPAAGQRILHLAALLAPHRAPAHAKRRIGDSHDGGYVMLDDWAGIAGAISIGIGNDDAWDRDVLARGVAVAQFDHTITAPPGTAPGLSWRPLGIAPADVNDVRCLRSLVALSGLPAEGDLVLKLDAEGAEWAALAAGEAAAPLARFRQVTIEFHWFERIADARWYEAALAALSHLHGTHAAVHVHANNWGGMALLGGIPFPRVLEVTWARRDAYALEPDPGPFPTPLDAPCNPARPDLFLGAFRFPAPPRA
jgi:hypothetical protein